MTQELPRGRLVNCSYLYHAGSRRSWSPARRANQGVPTSSSREELIAYERTPARIVVRISRQVSGRTRRPTKRPSSQFVRQHTLELQLPRSRRAQREALRHTRNLRAFDVERGSNFARLVLHHRE